MVSPTYRRVRTDFWTHPKTANLTVGAQNIMLRLATGGHPVCFHQVSVRRLGRPSLTEEQTMTALNELCSARHVIMDPDAEQVWLVQGLDEQGFTGPKNYVSCQRQLEGFERTWVTEMFGGYYIEACPDSWRTDKLPSDWDPEYPIRIPYPDTPFRDHRVGGADTLFQEKNAAIPVRDVAIAIAIAPAIASTAPAPRASSGPGNPGHLADLNIIGKTAAGADGSKLGRLVDSSDLDNIIEAYGRDHVEAVTEFVAVEVAQGRERGGTWGVLFGREGKVFEVMRSKMLEAGGASSATNADQAAAYALEHGKAPNGWTYSQGGELIRADA